LGLSKLRGARTLSKIHYLFHRKPYTVVLPGGAKLTIPHDPHYFGFLCGVHEPHITRILKEVLQAGDICIDVGANIGYFSMMMARFVTQSGMIYSLEPVNDTHEALQNNAQLARIEGFNVVPYNIALSDADGEIGLSKHIHSTASQVYKIDGAPVEDTCETVHCQTLDSFIQNAKITNTIKMVKIDVEGHEMEVVSGAIDTIQSKRINHIIVEVTEGLNAKRLDCLLTQYAKSIQIWNGYTWTFGRIQDIRFRTDVFVTF
jgi:FkbM family methyltransferase